MRSINYGLCGFAPLPGNLAPNPHGGRSSVFFSSFCNNYCVFEAVVTAIFHFLCDLSAGYEDERAVCPVRYI